MKNWLTAPEPSEEQRWICHYLRLADKMPADRWLLERAEAAAETSRVLTMRTKQLMRESAALLRERSELLGANLFAHYFKKSA